MRTAPKRRLPEAPPLQPSAKAGGFQASAAAAEAAPLPPPQQQHPFYTPPHRPLCHDASKLCVPGSPTAHHPPSHHSSSLLPTLPYPHSNKYVPHSGGASAASQLQSNLLAVLNDFLERSYGLQER